MAQRAYQGEPDQILSHPAGDLFGRWVRGEHALLGVEQQHRVRERLHERCDVRRHRAGRRIGVLDSRALLLPLPLRESVHDEGGRRERREQRNRRHAGDRQQDGRRRRGEQRGARAAHVANS